MDVALTEPDADAVAAQLDGARLAAPALLDFELANVCLIKCRRHPEQREALTAAFRLRHRLQIEHAAVDQDGVLALAGATRLTANDASYLWLARQLGAELVTLELLFAKAEKASRA